MNLFRKKTKLEILQEKYRNLMRKSFKVALTDMEKCEKVQNEANKIYKEINYLKVNSY